MAQKRKAKSDERSVPFRLAGRYEAQALLGSGGMATVYKAWDETRGSHVALKLLMVEADRDRAARSIELFEREFHTLVHLSHPRIVRALDYGVDDGQPFCALELLDGGDLREIAPLNWESVCAIAYEICSALSLLHSRRLVHRDLTPRNIRRTQGGQAKLIDFGLLSPMGPTTMLAGTAPFMPPELLNTMSLDGRSDLFSLGATLYYALTRRQPYSAKNFEQLPEAWCSSPLPPSAIVPGIPEALDELLLDLLRTDPGSRPKSAAEVMERLKPLRAVPVDDELDAGRAHLITPKLVGRDHLVTRFRALMARAMRGQGGGIAVVGDEGTGRSRMLDAFVLEAKLVGATAVRAGSEEAARPFGVAASLARQIHGAAPDVAVAAAARFPAVLSLLYPDAKAKREAAFAGDVVMGPVDVTRPDLNRAALQAALRTWILEFASRRPLAIAVDDLERIDEPSAALLALLSWEARTRPLAYLAVLPAREAGTRSGALEIVRNHAEEVRLEPLTTDEVTALFASVFGNAPHLGALSARFSALTGGRPRECLMFAEYLVDVGAITYGGGSWTLPAEFPDALLPENLESALALRVAQLGPVARHVAALLAENLLERLSRADLLSIGLESGVAVDAALHELVAARLVAGDPSGYALTGGAIAGMLSATLGADERSRIHDELSAIHEHAGRHTLFVAYHALRGSGAERALDRLAQETPTTEQRADFIMGAADLLGDSRTAHALDLATRSAERLGRPRFELQSLRGMLASMSARGADPAHFYRVAEVWLRQAKQDSGYDDWQKLDATLDPATRAMMAVGAVAQRYGETPEADRGHSPQEGIQQLVAYVLFSIAVSSRMLDRKLQVTLPEILVPFAPLNPLVSAILSDAQASCLLGEGRREHARAAFAEVLEQLEKVSGAELRYVEKVRAAVCYALANIDTSLGIPSVWLERYGEVEDQNQRLSALFLRKVAALQQGDWELAEKCRREAELFSLQNKATSMFSTLADELEVHAMARDLTGVRQARTSINEMLEKHPGWLQVAQLADAHYLRLCGDLEGALAALAPALAASEDDVLLNSWTLAGRVLAVQLLSELDRAEDALTLGLAELERCEARGMRQQARQLSLSIAKAAAKLGRFDEAMNRVEAVIAEQATAGVKGLQLGQSYEAAARIAIAAKDGDAFLRFAVHVHEQYRPGQSSVLGALYERLLDEARQAGLAGDTPGAEPQRVDLELLTVVDLATAVAGCKQPAERAERALGLLCDGDPPTRGHLLICKRGGLELVASNAPCTSVREIVSAATKCLEHESRTSNMQTSALSSMTFGEISTGWRDTEGVEYETVVLATTVDDTLCVSGIALLAKQGAARAGRLAPLADAIARTLIATGDAVSIAVA